MKSYNAAPMNALAAPPPAAPAVAPEAAPATDGAVREIRIETDGGTFSTCVYRGAAGKKAGAPEEMNFGDVNELTDYIKSTLAGGGDQDQDDAGPPQTAIA